MIPSTPAAGAERGPFKRRSSRAWAVVFVLGLTAFQKTLTVAGLIYITARAISGEFVFGATVLGQALLALYALHLLPLEVPACRSK